ncbi:hypothetical protein [uncultured Alsobacter sp.]|uniref:hypothetical protein n=1 Tax=uncultured Alsobacter sp. TaxID=1748258 RepID=UPI0025DC7EBB|nr:hypothetical protein [uncultured Alsobacter sp.]
MSDAWQGSVLGVKASAIIWGALGGATAAALGPGTWKHRFVTTTVGGAFAVALGPPLARIADAIEADRWGLSQAEIEPGVIYMAGVLGMMVCASVIEAARRVHDKTPSLVDHVLPKDD